MSKARMWMAAALAAAGAMAPVRAYDTLSDLLQDMEVKQGEAVRDYVAQHPGAPDLDNAKSLLLVHHLRRNEYAEAVKILEPRYEKLATRKDEATLRDLAEVVAPLFSCRIRSGQKEEARKLVARVRKDFEMHKDAEQIGKMLQRMEKEFVRPAAGEPLAVKFTALDGKAVDTAAWKDKVVVVYFWAVASPLARMELPALKSLYRKYHDQGLEIVGISLDEQKAKFEELVKKEEIPWPQECTGDGAEAELAKKHGIISVPALFVVGKDGKVAAADLHGKTLEAKIQELLK